MSELLAEIVALRSLLSQARSELTDIAIARDTARSERDQAVERERATLDDVEAYLRFGLGYEQAADDIAGLAHVGAAAEHADELAERIADEERPDVQSKDSGNG